MEKKTYDLMLSKGLSDDEMALVTGITIENLSNIKMLWGLEEDPDVLTYLSLVQKDSVKRYLELKKASAPRARVKGTGAGHGVLPCQLCGLNSHPIKWETEDRKDGPVIAGRLSEKCSQYPELKFWILKDKPDFRGLPMSTGQINGVQKTRL